MQPVLDCIQFKILSNNNTLKKNKFFSLCPKNETDKTEVFSRLHARKNQ